MNVGGDRPFMSVSHRGSTRDNLPQFKFHTYASAAFEPEAVMGASPLTPIADAIGRFLIIAGAVALVCSVAVAIPLSMFLLFFANFD